MYDLDSLQQGDGFIFALIGKGDEDWPPTLLPGINTLMGKKGLLNNNPFWGFSIEDSSFCAT